MHQSGSQRYGVYLGDGKYSHRTTKKGTKNRAARRGTTVPLAVLAAMTPDEAAEYVRRNRDREP